MTKEVERQKGCRPHNYLDDTTVQAKLKGSYRNCSIFESRSEEIGERGCRRMYKNIAHVCNSIVYFCIVFLWFFRARKVMLGPLTIQSGVGHWPKRGHMNSYFKK